MTVLMQAITLPNFGDAKVLQFQDLERPKPGPDEVLIKVRATSVNPVDWKTRQGGGVARFLSKPLPFILGWDVAGTIVERGDAVQNFALGDAVYGMIALPLGGAYAEYAVLPVADIALLPPRLTFTEAATLPLVSLTAWQALFEFGQLERGQEVLIHAGAGGVGHIAIQLAKWKGARVTTTASSHNHAFVKSLGADAVIDYKKERFEAAGRRFDLVLVAMGGEVLERSFAATKAGGRLVTILGTPNQDLAERFEITAGSVIVKPDGATLKQLADLVRAGIVTPSVQDIISWKDVAEAHDASEFKFLRGKIALSLG